MAYKDVVAGVQPYPQPISELPPTSAHLHLYSDSPLFLVDEANLQPFHGAGMRCFYSVGFAEEERNNDSLVYYLSDLLHVYHGKHARPNYATFLERHIDRDQVKHIHFDKEMKMKFKSHVFQY